MPITKGYASYELFENNANSYTLAAHQLDAGNHRAVVVVGAFMRTSETSFTASLTYGGTAMTSAIEQVTSSSSRYYRIGIWYLLMGQGASTTNHDVVASTAAIHGAILYAVTLFGVDQRSPVIITNWSTAVPSDLSLGYQVGMPSGVYALWAAMSTGNNKTWDASGDVSPTEIFELGPSPTDGTEPSAAGYDYIWSGADNITAMTLTRGGTPPAQVGVAFKLAPARPSLPLLRPGRRTYIRM